MKGANGYFRSVRTLVVTPIARTRVEAHVRESLLASSGWRAAVVLHEP